MVFAETLTHPLICPPPTMAKALSSLTVKHTIHTDTIQENTANHGVVVDGITIKDGGIAITALKLPTNAAVGYVLKCDNATTGNASWLPEAGGSGSSAPFDDNIPLVQNSADPTKRVIIDASAIATGTTRTVHAPDADSYLSNQDTSTTATPSFTGVQIPTGASLDYVLTCQNATSGNASWAPNTPAVQVETVSTTPYVVSSNSVATELVVNATGQAFSVTLPPITAKRRILTIRNQSSTHNVVLHPAGTDYIWVTGSTSLTLPPNSYTSLEAATNIWLSC
jgi:hypothetical protein